VSAAHAEYSHRYPRLQHTVSHFFSQSPNSTIRAGGANTMHKRILRIVVPIIALATAVVAGPTLACHEWVSTPGSAFETLQPLRDQAMSVANHPNERPAAIKQIATLRAAIHPDDPKSMLKAGYWIAILNSLEIAPDTDGPSLIRRA